MEELTCQLSGCNKTEKEHQMLAHQFSPREDQLHRRMVVQPSRLTGIGPDPVLRILLAKKGIITAEELEATEKELKAAGLLGGNEGAGYRSHGSSDRKVRDRPQA